MPASCRMALPAILMTLSSTQAFSGSAAQPDMSPVHASEVVSYACAEGKNLDVVYLNLQDGSSYATLLLEGQLVPMHQDISASGARYVSDDKTLSLVWHAKGETGILYRDIPASSLPLLDACSDKGS